MSGYRIMLDSAWDANLKRLRAEEKNQQAKSLQAVRKAALLAERELKLGIRNGAPGGQKFKPLALITLMLRKDRSSKPLLDTGALLGSIKTTVDAKAGTAFIGVHRTAYAADGENLVNVAMVHEFGTKPYAIPVTPGIRRLFWRLHLASDGRIKPISANKRFLQHPGVPARPFLQPTIDVIGPKISALVRATLAAGT